MAPVCSFVPGLNQITWFHKGFGRTYLHYCQHSLKHKLPFCVISNSSSVNAPAGHPINSHQRPPTSSYLIRCGGYNLSHHPKLLSAHHCHDLVSSRFSLALALNIPPPYLGGGDRCGGKCWNTHSMPRMSIDGPREAPSYVRFGTFLMGTCLETCRCAMVQENVFIHGEQQRALTSAPQDDSHHFPLIQSKRNCQQLQDIQCMYLAAL